MDALAAVRERVVDLVDDRKLKAAQRRLELAYQEARHQMYADQKKTDWFGKPVKW